MPTREPAIVVRPCQTAADMVAAMAIRVVVFVHEQNVPPELEPDEYDADAWHVLAQVGGEAVGTLRVVDKGNGLVKIGRVAVLALHRGAGVGNALMEYALQHIQAANFTQAALDAQLPVLAFYEKLGFVADGPVFEDAGILHRHMTLAISARVSTPL